MSDYAKLRYLPWMRRGLVRALAKTADSDGRPVGAVGSVTAAVTAAGTEVTRSLRVRGPEAVIGLNSAQVLREEPKPLSRDFETNYFPFVELASPDLPWQFTPAAPNADKLSPWLVLAVVEERDGVVYSARSTGPLPVLSIADGAGRELPNLLEAWAWAHVQASTTWSGSLDSAFAARPEAFVARLMCPRVLDVGTWYRACLVPAFEAGRQAGLGWTVSAEPTAAAWSAATESIELPVFHSWRFRTSAEPGDFESLVKALKARTLKDDVGVHDLDIGSPGTAALPDAPGTIVGFRGALVSPNLEEPDWDATHRTQWEDGLQGLLNEALAADGSREPRDYDALRDDPVLAPPAYGTLPADIDAIPDPGADPGWLRDGNLDPALRSAAGLGAEVVRRHQEALAAEAWDQAGALREANRTLNHARLALEVGKRMKARLDAMEEGTKLQITRGAHARLKDASMTTTVLGRTRESVLPDGLVSGGLRRRLRDGTALGRANKQVFSPKPPGSLASGITRGFVHRPDEKLAYATLTVPHGTVMGEEVAGPQRGGDLVTELGSAETLVDFGLVGSFEPVTRAAPARAGLSTEGRAPTPRTATAAPLTSAPPAGPGGTRSRTRAATAAPSAAVADRGFVVDSARLVSAVPVAVDGGGADALPITELAAVVDAKMDPSALLRLRVRDLIGAPEGAFGDEDVPASLAFSPEYPDPAYELLVRIDPELLMPGVGSIPDDTVALAKLNAPFVEAFLLGANDELSREFVWREVPVDPADTWMRTFWASVDVGAEDILRVRDWDGAPLGTHQPAGGMNPDRVLVLILKGDLLRRYPNTLIYAVPAVWEEETVEGTGETYVERVEDPAAERLWPIFVGSLGRGTTFLGFQFDAEDVDAEVAGSAEPLGPEPGWFFVFEQPPTEPRFGLDVGDPGRTGDAFEYWKNVSWYHAMGAAEWSETHAPIGVLRGRTKPIDKADPDRDDENSFDETWGRHAGAMAAITLQRPVRMLVHADQMLRPEED